MTDAERADFKRLTQDPAFLLFLYRMVRDAGFFQSNTERLEWHEGRRSLALDVLQQVERVQAISSPDGLPVLASIQILTAFAQSAPKEKDLGRRSDPYRDLGGDDGDGSPE